jgi:hypothetical protein
VLAELEHDVGQLGDEELLHREPYGVTGPRQARDELAAHAPRERPAHDGRRPDLLVGEHPEDLAKPFEPLLDHALYHLVGGVARRDARPARRDDGVYVRTREKIDEVVPYAGDLVPDEPALHHLLPRALQ